MTSICAVVRSCRSRTRTSLPAGEYDAALSIRFSSTVSIISSLPSTKIPGDSSPRSLMLRPGNSAPRLSISLPSNRGKSIDRRGSATRSAVASSKRRAEATSPSSRSSERSMLSIARWTRWFSGGNARRSGSADRRGRAVERVYHAIELGSNIGKLRDLIARRKASGPAALFADLPRLTGETAQPAADAEQGRKGDDDHHQVNGRGELHGWGCPIGLAEMGGGKGIGGEGCDHRPASRRRQQRRDDTDDLGATGRPVIHQRERQFAAAALRQLVEDPAPGQDLALRFKIAGHHRGPGSDVIEAVVIRAGRIEQQFDRRYLPRKPFELLAKPEQGIAIGILEQRQQGLAHHPP